MSGFVAGELSALTEYSELAVEADDAVAEALGRVDASRTALLSAPSHLAVETHDPGALLEPVLDRLAVLDLQPGAIAWALEQLDAGLPPGVARPPAPRRVRDDDAFDGMVESYTLARLVHAAESGTSLTLSRDDLLGLSIAGVAETAKRAPHVLDDLLSRLISVSEVPSGTWRWVRRTGGPLGFAITAYGDWSDTSEDRLATRGDRVASAASATALEGGLSALCAAGGAWAGAKGGAAIGTTAGPWGRPSAS